MKPRSFSWFVIKAFKYLVQRPLMRFNVANRATKYLGPDAPKFKLAPSAIGPMTQPAGFIGKLTNANVISKPQSFKSITSKRSAIGLNLTNKSTANPSSNDGHQSITYSDSLEDENRLIIEASNKLKVTKKLETVSDQSSVSTKPLPKLTSLQLQDPVNIWIVDKVPPGRLDINKLQELMLNILADENYWTIDKIVDSYGIAKEYAESITKNIKQIKIIISPRLYYNLEYVGRNNPTYQATKHLIYNVDASLRTEEDKVYDGLFEPNHPDPEIQRLINPMKMLDERGNCLLQLPPKEKEHIE